MTPETFFSYDSNMRKSRLAALHSRIELCLVVYHIPWLNKRPAKYDKNQSIITAFICEELLTVMVIAMLPV